MFVKKFVIDWFIPITLVLFAMYVNQSQPQPLGALGAGIVTIVLLIYLFLKAPFH